ncbi:zinc ribbon domain-containing protein [Staphylococcus saprophyticus]
MFDLEDNNFSTMRCKNCGYREFYKGDKNGRRDIMDLLFGG